MKVSRRNWLLGAGLASALPAQLHGTRRNEESEQAFVGIEKADLPTPSLVVDLDALESNIEKMGRHAREASINLRPHAKTHKCPEIAKRQIRAGALGVCTATIHEAETMARHGIQGILITSELVGSQKISRLIRLTEEKPDTMSVIDNAVHARQLSEAAQASNTDLNVLLDIDPGGRRTGVSSGEQALALAELVMQLPGLNLRGIHAYSGGSAHVQGFEERRLHSLQAMEGPLETFFRLKKLGMPLEILSGGSTGTYNIDTSFEGVTELQVGSYVFMDVDYRRIGGIDGPVYEDFAPSLSVIATVISKNHPDRATLDAGYKAFASDRRFGPDIKGVHGVEYRFGGDEHGILILENPSREIKLGDRLEFIVPHCDPNVNLYDRLFALRGNKVAEVWSIAGRGYR